MRTCEHPEDIYLDYRWLPETVHPFGREMARIYAESATALAAEAQKLAAATVKKLPKRVKELIRCDVARACFEAAEFKVMTAQQQAMNALGAFLSRGDRRDCRRGIAALGQAVKASEAAKKAAVKAGIPDNSWYYRNINGWLRGEFQRKAEFYAGYLTERKK